MNVNFQNCLDYIIYYKMLLIRYYLLIISVGNSYTPRGQKLISDNFNSEWLYIVCAYLCHLSFHPFILFFFVLIYLHGFFKEKLENRSILLCFIRFFA